MVTKLGFHWAVYLTYFVVEDNLIELGHHLAGAKTTERT